MSIRALHTVQDSLARLRGIVADQVADPVLWPEPRTATEAYLQQELRRLIREIQGIERGL